MNRKLARRAPRRQKAKKVRFAARTGVGVAVAVVRVGARGRGPADEWLYLCRVITPRPNNKRGSREKKNDYSSPIAEKNEIIPSPPRHPRNIRGSRQTGNANAEF